MLATLPNKPRCGGCVDREATPVKTEQSAGILSPTRDSFRVNKPSGRPSSRKQSYTTAIERIGQMDPGSYNFMGNGFSNDHAPAEHGPMNYEPLHTAGPQMMEQVYPPGFSYPIPTIPPPPHNGNMMVHPPMPMMHSGLVTDHGPGTLEGTTGYSSDASSVAFSSGIKTGSESSSLETNPPTAQRSCCASKSAVGGDIGSNSYDPIPSSNAGMQATPQPPTTSLQNVELYPSTINHSPYGTYERPLRYQDWQMGYIQEPNVQGGLGYECVCGPGCQCLGCRAHPFNSSTRDYINETYQLQNQAQNQDWMPQPSEGMNSAMPSGDSNSQASTPEEGGNNDLVWIQITCHGDESQCGCGDDCKCNGCQIHNQKTAEDLPVEEADDG